MKWDEVVDIISKHFKVYTDYPSLLLLLDGARDSLVAYVDDVKVLEMVHFPEENLVLYRVTFNERTIRSGKLKLDRLTSRELEHFLKTGEAWRD